MSGKKVLKKPYPPNLQFTEIEQQFYDSDKKEVDKTARELNSLSRNSGRVILIPDPLREAVSYKRLRQIDWDKGIDRPYSFNEDLILEKMRRMKEIIIAETDKTIKEQHKRVLTLLHPKLREAIELDATEAVRNKQETAGMEEEDTIDKDVVERRNYRERVKRIEEDNRRREKEEEDKRLAEEARLKKIEDDRIAEKRAKEEAELNRQRLQFKKQEIDPATRIVGITGGINLNEIDPNNKSQARGILRKMLVKLLLYKMIGENSSNFKRDLKKWLDKNEELGIDDEYEYDVFSRGNMYNIYGRYGVIYTTKPPTKEEMVKDKWKEPLKVKLRISSEFFNDNFLLQTLEGLGEQGRLITPEEWRSIEEEDRKKQEEREKARQDREERDRLEREARKKPKTKEQLKSETEIKMEEINERLDTLDEFGYLPDWVKESRENDKKKKTSKKKMSLKNYGLGVEAELNGAGVYIDDPELYEKAKAYADNIFKKPSAFKSGFIVKKYKEMGGTYSGEKPNKTGIARWFKEEWKDIGNEEYPVFRPTLKITEKTPLTPDEIKPSNLKKQIALKQKIKGDANLPPFLPLKKGGKLVEVDNIPKTDAIWEWSDPKKVAKKTKDYLGKNVVVFRADKPKKKYMIFDPDNKKWVYFGEMSYQDHTKHSDPIRRQNYLNRTANMRGDWKNNKYSANNLSRNILW